VELSADLPVELVAMGWLLGTWEGAGIVGYPTMDSLRFGQELVFEHVGKPFLAYRSQTWLLDDAGERGRPLASEAGFWRPRPGGMVEVVLAHPTGFVEIWLGEVGGAKLEIRTDVVARTASAKDYGAGHRLYGLVEGELFWAFDMAAGGEPLQSHASGRLKRVS